MIQSYPVFIIRVGSGYATMATPDSPEEKPEYAILVFTTESLAEDFIQAVGLEGAEVRFLHDERELGRVLAVQPEGVTHIAVDSVLKDGHLQTECLTLYEMVKKHLLYARSPWDYPVFFLRQTDGNYAAITTAEQQLVLAMFTANQKAKEYRSRLEHSSRYELLRVESPKRLLDFLLNLPKNLSAIALNPSVDENSKHSAVQCMAISKLIEKFLT